MSQHHDIESLSYEERVFLALDKIRCDPKISERRAAVMYNVKRTTLRDRRDGKSSRRDTHPNSSKLQKLEEDVLVQTIRKLGERGFAPTLSYVKDMANQLLAARGGGQVGENWVTTFIRRKPELKSKLTRQRDLQRVLCSNVGVISPWFDLVRNVKAKYGILDDDTYNFDETGFAMGTGNRVKVVTASESRTQPIGVQQGDREWVTFIAGINAMGWAIAPYLSSKQRTTMRPGTMI